MRPVAHAPSERRAPDRIPGPRRLGVLGERARSGAGPITYGDVAPQIKDDHADLDLPTAPADAVVIGVKVVNADGTEPRALAADAPATLDDEELEEPTAGELEEPTAG